jgi:hypothetical protein
MEQISYKFTVKYLTYRNSHPYNRQENKIGKDCDGDSKLILNVFSEAGMVQARYK